MHYAFVMDKVKSKANLDEKFPHTLFTQLYQAIGITMTIELALMAELLLIWRASLTFGH